MHCGRSRDPSQCGVPSTPLSLAAPEERWGLHRAWARARVQMWAHWDPLAVCVCVCVCVCEEGICGEGDTLDKVHYR